MNAGVQFPLLGTLRRQLDALTKTRFDAQRKHFETALRRAAHTLSLKATYADWWRAQQEISVCDKLLQQAGSAQAKVQQRQNAGWLRQSEALGENAQWHDLTTRCQTATVATAELKTLLELGSGQTLPPNATPVFVPLHVNPAPLDLWQAQVDQHPRVRSQASSVAENQQLKDRPWYNSIDASLTVGLSLEDRSGVSNNGNSFVAALNLSIPFDLGGHSTVTGNAAAARYQAARYQLQAERRQLIADIATTLQSLRQAHTALLQSEQNVATTQTRLAEQKARAALDTENGFTLLQAAERDVFRAQLDRIANWHALWLQLSALQVFTDENPQAEALLGQSTLTWSPVASRQQHKVQRFGGSAENATTRPSRTQPTRQTVATITAKSSPWALGTYIWDSRPLLDANRRPGELDALQAANIQRLYIGLDAEQVRRTEQTKTAIRALIKQANARGMHVLLLLGEPLWLTPRHRGDLVTLIRSFSDLPFEALHLDLEVEQLGWPVPDDRLLHWLDTLQEASKASPWPIEISSHHRWFETPDDNRPCIPCALPDLGIKTVSLMIYTKNAERSTALTQAAAQRWPALRFRLAQSMETTLSADESWANATANQVDNSLKLWRERLMPEGVQGVDWQAWDNLQQYDLSKRNRP